MAAPEQNAAVKARFERLLARAVRRSRVTRVLADAPTFRMPRQDGLVGVLSLDDVGPPGEPQLRIVWFVEATETLQAGDPTDLTDRDENDALRVIVGTEGL
jgi:hypothetical protein